MVAAVGVVDTAEDHSHRNQFPARSGHTLNRSHRHRSIRYLHSDDSCCDSLRRERTLGAAEAEVPCPGLDQSRGREADAQTQRLVDGLRQERRSEACVRGRRPLRFV